eukprot:2718517-Rhodomonas_salina.1
MHAQRHRDTDTDTDTDREKQGQRDRARHTQREREREREERADRELPACFLRGFVHVVRNPWYHHTLPQYPAYPTSVPFIAYQSRSTIVYLSTTHPFPYRTTRRTIVHVGTGRRVAK